MSLLAIVLRRVKAFVALARLWCWIKSSFVDLDGWENGWFWFGWSEFLRGD
jgi:hypothetical protein